MIFDINFLPKNIEFAVFSFLQRKTFLLLRANLDKHFKFKLKPKCFEKHFCAGWV